MARSASQETWRILQPTVEGMGYEFVGVEYLGQGGRNTLRVYIDTEKGVTLEDCEAVSHQISGLLDVEDPLGNAYDLEVSSPGLDRPLFKAEDYARYAGQRIKIRMVIPVDGRRNFTGQLLGLKNDLVLVEVDGKNFELIYEQIERAKLVPQF